MHPTLELWFVGGGVFLVFVGQATLFARWLYRRESINDVNRLFVRDMATNHLPHIYHELAQIGNHLGIPKSEPPPIQWVNVGKVEE